MTMVGTCDAWCPKQVAQQNGEVDAEHSAVCKRGHHHTSDKVGDTQQSYAAGSILQAVVSGLGHEGKHQDEVEQDCIFEYDCDSQDDTPVLAQHMYVCLDPFTETYHWWAASREELSQPLQGMVPVCWLGDSRC